MNSRAQRSKRIWSRVSAIIVVIIMVVIFMFSAQPGAESNYVSGSLTDKVIHAVNPQFDELPTAQQEAVFHSWDYYVRRAAHFCEYAGLAFWVFVHIAARGGDATGFGGAASGGVATGRGDATACKFEAGRSRDDAGRMGGASSGATARSLDGLLAVGITFLYACSDELHQYFVPGRNGVFKDALWDSCGAIFGVLVAALVVALVRKSVAKKQ